MIDEVDKITDLDQSNLALLQKILTSIHQQSTGIIYVDTVPTQLEYGKIAIFDDESDQKIYIKTAKGSIIQLDTEEPPYDRGLEDTSRYTTTQTLDGTDRIVFCNTDGGAWTVSLPSGTEGKNYRIINTGSSGNALIIDPDGADKILGANSQTLYDGEVLNIFYNETDGWW